MLSPPGDHHQGEEHEAASSSRLTISGSAALFGLWEREEMQAMPLRVRGIVAPSADEAVGMVTLDGNYTIVSSMHSAVISTIHSQ
jgi:hypothetical protein